MKKALYIIGITLAAAITGFLIGCYSLEVTGICF